MAGIAALSFGGSAASTAVLPSANVEATSTASNLFMGFSQDSLDCDRP